MSAPRDRSRVAKPSSPLRLFSQAIAAGPVLADLEPGDMSIPRLRIEAALNLPASPRLDAIGEGAIDVRAWMVSQSPGDPSRISHFFDLHFSCRRWACVSSCETSVESWWP